MDLMHLCEKYNYTTLDINTDSVTIDTIKRTQIEGYGFN